MEKHENHFCANNDGECICKCYSDGFKQGKKEVIEDIRKHLIEYMEKLCWSDRDIKYLINYLNRL